VQFQIPESQFPHLTRRMLGSEIGFLSQYL